MPSCLAHEHESNLGGSAVRVETSSPQLDATHGPHVGARQRLPPRWPRCQQRFLCPVMLQGRKHAALLVSNVTLLSAEVRRVHGACERGAVFFEAA